VTTAAGRSLCAGLSHRLEVVFNSKPADPAVQTVIAHVTLIDVAAAGLSKGASVAKKNLLSDVQAPVSHASYELSSLSPETEARNHSGKQKIAMFWSREANALLGKRQMSKEGYMYALVAAFGRDFSKTLVNGSTSFGGPPTIPPVEGRGSLLEGAHIYPACEIFERFSGLTGFLEDQLALPIEWTDWGASSRD
jgi:hypothetical protein